MISKVDPLRSVVDVQNISVKFQSFRNYSELFYQDTAYFRLRDGFIACRKSTIDTQINQEAKCKSLT